MHQLRASLKKPFLALNFKKYPTVGWGVKENIIEHTSFHLCPLTRFFPLRLVMCVYLEIEIFSFKVFAFGVSSMFICSSYACFSMGETNKQSEKQTERREEIHYFLND